MIPHRRSRSSSTRLGANNRWCPIPAGLLAGRRSQPRRVQHRRRQFSCPRGGTSRVADGISGAAGDFNRQPGSSMPPWRAQSRRPRQWPGVGALHRVFAQVNERPARRLGTSGAEVMAAPALPQAKLAMLNSGQLPGTACAEVCLRGTATIREPSTTH